MIKVNCETEFHLLLSQLTPFQGDLKKRTEKDVRELAKSLQEVGLILPFVVWTSENSYKLLDGHGRYAALVKLGLEDASILLQEWPVLIVEASSEEDARKKLLQISSQYGKITPKGLANFTATIPGYKPYSAAPVKAVTVKPQISDDRCIVKISINKSQVNQLTDLLRQVKGIEVL
jgi:hypothetical protein